MDEFALIQTIFQQPQLTHVGNGGSSPVSLGIGDDCALFTLPADRALVQSIDTLVADVHFPASGDPKLIGYRALAVAVSDLAAMGALPHSFLLAISLPKSNVVWLEHFATGLATMAQQAGIALIGGDTTRGPLTITVHVQGTVALGSHSDFHRKPQTLLRSGAKPGDQVYVSGFPGEASAALSYVLGEKSVTTGSEQHLLDRYWLPTPRLALGQWLAANGATAALDISDGLSGDLQHLLRASDCGVELFSDNLPISKALAETCSDKALQHVLHGGDDYELCFTWPADKPALATLLPPELAPVHRIGSITAERSFLLDGVPYQASGYNHFL